MNRDDMLGRRFGLLTVAEDSGQRRGSSVLWRCRCDCGGERLATRQQLASGQAVSCGCRPAAAPPRVAGLPGQRFGLLTVVGDSGQRKGGGVLWHCRCDCGGETLATRRQLESGRIASCGCVPRPCASRRQAEDLTGRQFGALTVLCRAENDKQGKVCWLCRCTCGRELAVPAQRLKSGKTKSCGCQKYGAAGKRYDLTGRRFGRLTALYHINRADRAKSSYWHCRCDCGSELDVSTENLLRGLTQSCGCWNREQSAKMHDHMHYQDDTCVEVLKRACTDTGRNSTGFRGLYQLKSGKYRASITFRGRHYDLGHYDSFAQAAQARRDAEEVLHMGYIKAFARYEEKAKADPAWARDNPFFYQVMRANGGFQICTNGNETEPALTGK